MNTISASKGRMKGLFALSFLIFSTLIFFMPVFFLGLLKLVPYMPWRIKLTQSIDSIIEAWCRVNNLFINHSQKTIWEFEGINELNFKADDWYLVIANHQSWLDIVLLQRLFCQKIPVLKFFIKDQLKWIPLLGFSWWAMGSPFMKRYSKEHLLKYPHKRGQDLKATQKALKLFKATPSSIMNFIEGTRFTPAKKLAQQSPYAHLLKPKAGGIAHVISSMNDKIHTVLDVTIIYADKKYSLWDFLCQRVHSIHASVRTMPIPKQFINKNLLENEALQKEFRAWLNALWAEKDALIARRK